MSDDAIIELYAQGAKGEKKWYLDQEIQVRGLKVEATEKRKDEVKKNATPITIGKILFFVILIGIFGSRLLKKFGS